jgi:ABC-type Fe3+-siderophore transport system permease subunit
VADGDTLRATSIHTGRKRNPRTALRLFIGLFLLMLAAAIVGTFVGVKGLTWHNLSTVMDVNPENVLAYKVWYVRFPRVVLAVILGMGLAVSGCLLQGMTRNPLSDPEVLGINQGASFFVVLALFLFGLKDVTATIMIAGFLGAALGGSVVYGLSLLGTFTSTSMVLAGVAVAFFMGSMTTGLIILGDDRLSEILYWMAGKLSGANWFDVQLSLISVIPAVIASWLLSNQFNILSLGDEMASGVGQRVNQIRRLAFLLIIVIVGSSVALAGPIGFVGLIIPHMAKSLLGTDHRIVIPFSALMGANLLLIADIGGQWMLYPTDIPVGIITILLGTPFFLYLMNRKKEEMKL